MKIIAATDGSPCSQAAIDALLGMNCPAGTEVKLVTVVRQPDTGFSFPGTPPAIGTSQQKELLEMTTQAVSTMARELQQNLGNCQVSYEIGIGDAKAHIVEFAKGWAADLIIMGSRGIKGLDLMLLGSVSQSVLMQSPCPVIIVKSEGRIQGQDLQRGFNNILLTVDNSPFSRAALQWLMSIDWPITTRFKLVTVIQSLTQAFDRDGSMTAASGLIEDHETLNEAARQELTKLAQELAAKVGADRVSSEVGEGDPREAILNIAEASSSDLIVMGSHGRTGLTKIFMGSVSQAVSVHAPSAVAIVRGIVPKGKTTMQQTGMFALPGKKANPAPKPATAAEQERDTTPHVPPGGMM